VTVSRSLEERPGETRSEFVVIVLGKDFVVVILGVHLDLHTTVGSVL